jgi:magnesium-transporting ATPase (P-type)
VTAITPRRAAVVAGSSGLLLTSLGLVVAGHFISWNDVRGDQWSSWNYGYGDLSALCATVGASVSLVDRVARQLAGASVAAFAVFLVLARVAGDDFSFVGSTDAFGLNFWTIMLGMAAFVLLTPRWTRVGEWWERRPGRRRLTTWTRWDLYVVALLPVSSIVIYVAMAVTAMGHPECNQTGDACGEEYAGFFFGLVAVALMIVVIVCAEIVSAVRCWSRRRRRSHPRPSY